MKRGEVWIGHAGEKRRPVLVLTRSHVIGSRAFVTVAAITTTVRQLETEVRFDRLAAGVNRESVINCDGLYTVSRTSLSRYLGRVSADTMARVCAAVNYAIGC